MSRFDAREAGYRMPAEWEPMAATWLAPDTLSAFRKETGIQVRHDAYDSDATLQAKLMTGDSGHDLVWPSNDVMARQIQAGAFRELDRRRLPNLRHLDPALLRLAAQADPGNRYGVPYMWGTVGVGYDRAKLSAILGKDLPADSLALVFDPRSPRGSPRIAGSAGRTRRASCCRSRCAISAAIPCIRARPIMRRRR
jgi:spermidine/putrescine-binding protein